MVENAHRRLVPLYLGYARIDPRSISQRKERGMLNRLMEKYHAWRRSTFPASKDDIAWRHESTIREIQHLKRAASQSGNYYYLGKNWGLTTLANGLPFYVNTNDRHISPRIILYGKWEDYNDEL